MYPSYLTTKQYSKIMILKINIMNENYPNLWTMKQYTYPYCTAKQYMIKHFDLVPPQLLLLLFGLKTALQQNYYVAASHTWYMQSEMDLVEHSTRQCNSWNW